MPNNSPEQIRKKLYEEYEDSLFKLVMHDVAEKEGRLFLEEKEKLKNDPEYLPSQAAVQKFSRQLDAQLRKPRVYAGSLLIWQALNKAAIAMLIVLVILGSTVVTVEAVRVRALNFLMDIQQEYTSFQLKDSSDAEGGSVTIDWPRSYIPTYIPEGYEIVNARKDKQSSFIEFQNPKGESITYMELMQEIKPHLDTENASEIETVSINGFEGTLVMKESSVTLIWAMDDRMFMIRGQIDKDTAVRIAEGVKYIE
ncbi:MAG: DUF4367 domain-containing protein [Syntrophomonadaceae bacterium]|nr:DUF4367 domain-containing protein [Syntrophomonadaceae bacterium]